MDIRRCLIRIAEWVDLLRLDEGWAAFLGCVSDYVDIVEGTDLDLRSRKKGKILAVYIEKWSSGFAPTYLCIRNKGRLHVWMQRRYSAYYYSMLYIAVLTPNNNLVAPRVGIINYIYTASIKYRCRVIVHCGNLMAFILGDLLLNLAPGSRRFSTRSSANGSLLIPRSATLQIYKYSSPGETIIVKKMPQGCHETHTIKSGLSERIRVSALRGPSCS